MIKLELTQELANIWKEYKKEGMLMSELGKKYKRVIKNVEENLQNKDDIQYVKKQLDDFINSISRRIRGN